MAPIDRSRNDWSCSRASRAGRSKAIIPSISSTENGSIESFNIELRDECLNANQFLSIDDARSKIEAWRRDYNHHRPHGALGQLTPSEYLRRSVIEAKEVAELQR
ncbi:MAG TPA: transposase [Steroidobacteraceae bacterium]|nr:transposase [Steroidobacteraceae bacterium]